MSSNLKGLVGYCMSNCGKAWGVDLQIGKWLPSADPIIVEEAHLIPALTLENTE